MGQPLGGHVGKLLRREAGTGFVEDDTQCVKVRRGRTGTFWRDVAFSPDECATLRTRRSHKADISEFGAAAHVDNVAGLYVAVDELVAMELGQAAHNVEREAEAITRRQAAQAFEIGAQGA